MKVQIQRKIPGIWERKRQVKVLKKEDHAVAVSWTIPPMVNSHRLKKKKKQPIKNKTNKKNQTDVLSTSDNIYLRQSIILAWLKPELMVLVCGFFCTKKVE